MIILDPSDLLACFRHLGGLDWSDLLERLKGLIPYIVAVGKLVEFLFARIRTSKEQKQRKALESALENIIKALDNRASSARRQNKKPVKKLQRARA